MSQRFRDSAAVAAIVAALLLALWGALALRHRGGAAKVPPLPPGGQAEAPGRTTVPPAVRESPPGAATAVSTADPAASPVAAPETAAKPAAPTVTPETWSKRQPGDFTSDDLAQCGRGVRVDLGTYQATVGNEVEIAVHIAAPALESCTLVMQYDKTALAIVPGSAVPKGTQFRSGVECYAAEGSGRLVVIHAGTPGKKNLDASAGGTASVTYRMRALRPGPTRLVVLRESSFTNGRGEDETYDVSGGEVSIR